jgi:chemotaxis regulatin CheY-phosphate phosphatase CheZ
MPKSNIARAAPAAPDASPEEKPVSPAAVIRALPQPASEAFAVIQSILDRLQQSHEVLRESGALKLQDSNTKLREVSSATESAAMDIMDGVGRALGLVDRLESEREPSETSAELRDELFGIMDHLQFQDITTQQLQYTSSLLGELETELLGFVARLGILDLPAPPEEEAGAPRPVGFDPRATMSDAESRQAAADALLLSREAPEDPRDV